MDLLSQKPCLSTDPETLGFDLSTGSTYIYPKNHPIRDYQFAIVKTALFNNTLVCLPTGLGKTFIAAVVMYNFWRWYPKGIIVFLAPTKPLVTQQVSACNDIMGIPVSETIELTGAVNQKSRMDLWRTKRVLFATPQTFQNDLIRGIIPTELIKCVVIDEAHKALGKQAFSESIRILNQSSKFYRVLALSATPGSKLDAVQEVIRNLNITHLELRDDTSPDVIPYINKRKLDIIQVGLGDVLTKFYDRYKLSMDPHFEVLLKNRVIRGNVDDFSKGRIFLLRKEYTNRPNKTGAHGIIMKNLNILLTMCHAKELLENHGLRAFYNFYQNHQDKNWINDKLDLFKLLDDIKEVIGPFPDASAQLTNDDIANLPKNIIFGHEKFYRLKEILVEHFQNAEKDKIDTRAIVFVEYRDIVNEIYILLQQSQPLIKPQIFVGQAGLKQKDQKIALEYFRNNTVNVLISTSVGEEGLDVGEVDLIICFDITQHSPTRLVQRMGRTGRRRDGHIIALVSERENKTLNSAMRKRDSLNMKVLHSSGVTEALNNSSPRMVPCDLEPECLQMHITVIPATPQAKKRKKKEPKKPRASKGSKKLKLADDSTNKPSTFSKCSSTPSKGQSTMMNFLQLDKNKADADDDIEIIQTSEKRMEDFSGTSTPKQLNLGKNFGIKPSDVKILSSSNDTIEFLTLCTMKMSLKEMRKNSEQNLSISYCSSTVDSNFNVLDNFEVPSLDVLNCISKLEAFELPNWADFDDFTVTRTQNQLQEFCNENFFEDNYENPKSSPIDGQTRFEDFFDNLSSDSDEVNQARQQNSPPHEKVDWGKSVFSQSDGEITAENAFEKLMDQSSNDSIVEISDTSVEKEEHKPKWIQEILSSGEEEKIVDLIKDNSQPFLDRMNTSDPTIDKIEKTKTGGSSNFDINAAFDSDFDLSDVDNNSNTPTNILVNQQIFPIILPKIQTPKSVKHNINFEVSPDLSRSRRGRNYKSQLTPVNLEGKFQCRIDDDISKKRIEDLNKTNMFERKLSFEKISKIDMDTTNKVKNESNCQDSFEEFNNSPLKSKKKSREWNLSDFDWSSDFEEPETNSLTESKYFKSKTPVKNESETFSGRSQKENEYDVSNRNDLFANNKTNLNNKSPINIKNTPQKADQNEKTNSIGFDRISPVKSVFKGLENNNSDKLETNRKLFNPERSKSFELKSKFSSPKRPAFSGNENGSRWLSAKKVEEAKAEFKVPINPTSYTKTKKKRVKKKQKNYFIDDEAVVSDDESVSSDSHSGSDHDPDLDSFVSYTQDCADKSHVDMKALYLQSVRSPLNRGKFLIKHSKTKTPPREEIFSQEVPNEPNSYLYDSFCVDDVISEEEDANSILDHLERQLKKRKRKRREYSNQPKRRRKIVTNSSSEDEMEMLRAQVAEQSMMLKKYKML